MKLSVSAYRAQASAHKKILNNSYQMLLNYGATCTTVQSHQHLPIPAVKVEEVEAPIGSHDASSCSSQPMMVDSTGIGPSGGGGEKPGGPRTEQVLSEGSQSESTPANSLVTSREEDADADEECEQGPTTSSKRNSLTSTEKSPGHRTKSNQRWMKLRTTVQLSGAITTIQKKPPLKREDSFLKRFSTRQIPETQETVDTGDDGDGGPSSHNSASTRRRRRRRKPLPRTVVNPDENFFFYWLFVLTVCVLYNLWTLIVRQSFPELQSGATVFWYTCDGFSDAVFLLDIAVQFRTGYLEQGLMVYNSKKLAGHYIQSRAFLLDLSALLPLDLLQINIGVNPILRFPRFLKVYRIYHYYYMVESRTVYPNLWRVMNLIHILLILAHWFGCFYYLLSEAEGFQGDWVYPYRPGDYSTLTRKYLGSLYWSTLTLTTIGDLPTPETNADSRKSGSSSSTSSSSSSADGPQALPRRGLKSRLLQFSSNRGYVFTIVSYLIGVFIFATIVGQVGNVITNRNANRLEFERLLDGAKTYMRHHKVPGGMKRRVLRWYDYSWSRGRIQGGGDINTALGLLPDKLKTELALHVNLSVLKKVTIFQECQPEFLHDLVLKMKAYIFTPGDLICRKGEVAREMFIIADGILEVMSETGRVLTTMKAGDFFGEIGILNLDGLNKRTADVRSVGYSELFSLSREDVLAAMKDYPEAQEILQSLGRKRLMEARNVNKPRSGSAPHSNKGGSTRDGAGLKYGSSADVDNKAGKRIVEKLRSDVKGIKNALRKSRRSVRMKEEALELQPLNPGSVETYRHDQPSCSYSSGKGMLRRMSRVRSDENGSQEDYHDEQSCEPIGAGLPLIQRLRILKEKTSREESVRPQVSPTSLPNSTILSPPKIRVNKPKEGEVIGAGLPLIQRLLLLKQKEEKEKEVLQLTPLSKVDVLSSPVSKSQVALDGKTPDSIVSLPLTKTDTLNEESRISSLKEHHEDESYTTNRKTSSILTRLIPIKHKELQSALKNPQSFPRIVTTEINSDPSTTEKVPLLNENYKDSTQRDEPNKDKKNGLDESAVKLKTPLSSITALKTETSLKREATAKSAPMKKQQSWTLLKKASIVSSPGINNTNISQGNSEFLENKPTLRPISVKITPLLETGAQFGENQINTTDIILSLVDKSSIVVSNSHNESGLESSSSIVPGNKFQVSITRFPNQIIAQNEEEIMLGNGQEVPNSEESVSLITTHCIAQTNKIQDSDGHQIAKVVCTSEAFESNTVESRIKMLKDELNDSPVLNKTNNVASASLQEMQLPKPKPNLLQIQEDTKFYMSIDDLSPEYSGLPFVKKLKILNERQKLAELEKKVASVFMRSSSLDSSNTSRVGTNSVDGSDYQLDPTNLTRSHSEASAMEYVRSQQLSRDAFHRASSEAGGKKDHSPHIPTRPIDLPSTVLRKLAQQPLISPESNETVERRNLKSILKKLSASNLLSGSSEESEDKRNTSIDSSESSPDITLITQTTPAEIRKLMRAPTLEGYAARHSKLAKSVTFNRNTLQSPPSTATTPTSISDESTTLMFPLLNTNATEIEMSDKSTTTATCADVSITTTTSITSSSVLASTMAITTSVQQDSFSSKTTYKPTPYMPLCSSPSVESISTTSITTVNDISPFSCNIPMLVTATNASCQTLPYCKTASMGSNDEIRTTPSSNASPVTTPSVQETQKKPPVSFLMHHSPLIFSSNQKNMFRPPLLLPSHADYEEEYFGEIITGIKQVIQGHLEEIQSKFQSQFQSLELEVRRRDEIISQLQQRIHELEHPVSKEIDQSEEDCDISDIEDLSDQPFMRGDSVDTVLASPLRHLPEELNELLPGEGISSRRHLIHRHSWEDHSEEESMEIMDLPRSISPQYVWSDNNSTMVNLGSDSSPDDELSDDETTDQVGEYEGVNNQDWEVQMLAKELERREDMSRLENEVQNLKQVVSSSDLNSLSSSELEILEKLLMSKDRKVRAASRALSLDSDEGWEEKPIHQKIHKSSVRSPPVSSLNRRLSRQHSYSGGGSIENLLQRTNILKNRLLSRGDASSMEVRESQLLNARSLEEQVDPLTGPGQSGPSSSSLSPTCFFPTNLMRGLGHLVRHSSSPGQSQTASAESVPTISQSCRDLTPPDV